MRPIINTLQELVSRDKKIQQKIQIFVDFRNGIYYYWK